MLFPIAHFAAVDTLGKASAGQLVSRQTGEVPHSTVMDSLCLPGSKNPGPQIELC